MSNGQLALNVGRWSCKRVGEPTELELRRRLDALGYRTSLYVYPPGTRFPPQFHDVDKVDAALSGQFWISAESTVADLGPGDWVVIPRGLLHSAMVIGEAAVVSRDAVRVG